MNFLVSHIQNVIQAQSLGASASEVLISEIVFDTRKISVPENAMFVALKGEFRNGHDFIAQAYNKGFRVFLVESTYQIEISQYPDACFLVVESSLKSLQTLAEQHRKQYSFPVVGITGSNGKTVVKEWLYELLQSDFSIYRSPRSFNSQLGVAISLLGVAPGNQMALIEAGISQTGEMDALWKMIQPSLTVLTHLGSQHDAGFSSTSQKVLEKIKLCKDADVVVFPRDIEVFSEGLASLKKEQPLTRLITWGYTEGSTFRLLNVEKTKAGQIIHFYNRGTEHSLEIPFFDEASVANAMTCFCVLYAFERWDEAHILKFKNLKPIHNRLTIEKGKRGNVILNDSYSNDIESLGIAIDVIQRQQPNLPLMLILSEMDQIGHSDKVDQKVIQLLNHKSISRIFYLGQYKLQFSESIEVQYFTNTEELIQSGCLLDITSTAILVKGARKFHLEQVVEILKERLHKTSLEIHLESIKHNLRYFKRKISADTKMMCMVKAFGYGSGTFEVSKTLQDLNVDYLGVAFADEGVALREAGIHAPIMVMNTDAQTMDVLNRYNLEPVVYSLSNLQSYMTILEGQEGRIHLEIDTGMHRLGFNPAEILSAVKMIPSNIKVMSVFSHLAVSEDEQKDAFTEKQAVTFFEMAKGIESFLGYSILKHISNTGGIERFSELQGNMVRLGIGLYGLEPNGTENTDLQTVASLYSTITQIHEIAENEGIGYGLHNNEPNKRRIATIAMGYADGLSRRFGKKGGSVLINGIEAPFVGNICMDMSMVDVTNIPCIEGDRVEIFGEHLSINKMARRGGTISYEILTGISQRVPRIYLGDN